MGFTRREFLRAGLGGAVLGGAGLFLWRRFTMPRWHEQVFIAAVPTYQADIAGAILSGLRELGVAPAAIRGKRVLLKPNLVETDPHSIHINTHPLVVRGAAEAFLKLGADRVLVAEGPGHCQDTLRVLEESGLSEVLREDHIPFVDLNYLEGFSLPMRPFYAPGQFDLPADFSSGGSGGLPGQTQDPPLGRRHPVHEKPVWRHVGMYYGWPKNVLHQAGITGSILDITATLRPQLAIVDGIVGMEGDGPIMGTPKPAGVLVMGRNLPAVDATCTRVMGSTLTGLNTWPKAERFLGPVSEAAIIQLGEPIARVRGNFKLLDFIPAHRRLLL